MNLSEIFTTKPCPSLVLLLTFLFQSGCEVDFINNQISGNYNQKTTAPVKLSLDISPCPTTPPEGLAFSCQLTAKYLFSPTDENQNINKSSLSNRFTYLLLQNDCPGLSLTKAGVLSGTILKRRSETCRLLFSVSSFGLKTLRKLDLVVTAGLKLSFDRENVPLKEGGDSQFLELHISKAVPYDTHFNFEIFGEPRSILSGISTLSKSIAIQKGDLKKRFQLYLLPDTLETNVVHQQIQVTQGGRLPLPSVNLNYYSHNNFFPSFESISAGKQHSCAIDQGTLYCWGSDFYGQIGNGVRSSDLVIHPQVIGNSRGWESISAGDSHTCGINQSELFCWGSDREGQLGNDAVASPDLVRPTKIGHLSQWSHISAGSSHTCGIQAGQLYCWGNNTYGQVGSNQMDSSELSYLNVFVPTRLGGLSSWTAVSNGMYHSCAISDGNLFCWGSDRSGQIGDGPNGPVVIQLPVQIDPSSAWSHVKSGAFHTCALNRGELFCWGSNLYGQIGNGVSAARAVDAPMRIGPSNGWTHLGIGNQHSCGLNQGSLFCWGKDLNGQVGNGRTDSNNASSPIAIGNSIDWSNITAGGQHTCGMKKDQLYCWGSDSAGQLGAGQGQLSDIYSPKSIGTGSNWSQVNAGTAQTCGVLHGELFCWGSDSFGQVGNGPESYADVTQPVKIHTSIGWLLAATGGHHSCGINAGALSCWGSNSYGQLGNGEQSSSVIHSPTDIGLPGDWRSVSAGTHHTCAIDGGKLFCWGWNGFGQLGLGFADGRPLITPRQIEDWTTWTKVAAGNNHTCGISLGELYCWGNHRSGQVGAGNAGNPNAPIVLPLKVGKGAGWTHITSAFTHSCGIKDGSLYCWGSDAQGQVGNGDSSSRKVTTIELIDGSSDWTHVAVGDAFSCGIKGGNLHCWGSDFHGQLGNGPASQAAVSSPQSLGESNLWTQVTTGKFHSCGIANGKLLCWGRNIRGQVGRRPIDSHSPLLIMEYSRRAFE